MRSLKLFGSRFWPSENRPWMNNIARNFRIPRTLVNNIALRPQAVLQHRLVYYTVTQIHVKSFNLSKRGFFAI